MSLHSELKGMRVEIPASLADERYGRIIDPGMTSTDKAKVRLEKSRKVVEIHLDDLTPVD